MSDEYTKSLEETIAKQERVIEDFGADRDRIVKMLKTLQQSASEIRADIDRLADPLCPSGGEPQKAIIRDVIKKKLHETMGRFCDDITVIMSYSNSDPSEYKKTGKHWAVPVIRTVKDRS